MDEVKAAPVIETTDGMHTGPTSPDLKQEDGIALIPRPSDDPRDPLVGEPYEDLICSN